MDYVGMIRYSSKQTWLGSEEWPRPCYEIDENEKMMTMMKMMKMMKMMTMMSSHEGAK